jgi:hypothetical protein
MSKSRRSFVTSSKSITEKSIKKLAFSLVERLTALFAANNKINEREKPSV